MNHLTSAELVATLGVELGHRISRDAANVRKYRGLVRGQQLINSLAGLVVVQIEQMDIREQE